MVMNIGIKDCWKPITDHFINIKHRKEAILEFMKIDLKKIGT